MNRDMAKGIAKGIAIKTIENPFSRDHSILLIKNLLESFENGRFFYQDSYFPEILELRLWIKNLKTYEVFYNDR